jgi:hypothetical protein
MAEDFLTGGKSPYLFAPSESGVMGLLKSTGTNIAADVLGRYLYDKIIGPEIVKIVGSTLGTYANIGSGAIYAIAANLIAQKGVSSSFWSNFIQVAGAVPVSDYIAKALGDPLGPGLLPSKSNGVDAQEAAEEAYVRQLMGQGPSIAMNSTRGY